MSDAVCSRFVLHSWKADVCANCSRPRLKHVDTANVAVPPSSERSCSASSPATVSKHVDTRLCESAHVAAAKPSPIKTKPVVSAKPEKPKKPDLVGDQTPVKSNNKQCDEPTSTEHPTPPKLTNTIPSHFIVDEAEVTDTKQIPVEDEEFCSSEKGFHHYELYDVTARGSSGTAREFEVGNGTVGVDQSLNLEQRKFRTLPAVAPRVVEVAEEHVAMPYNVVDVTIRRPCASNVTPLSSDTVSSAPPTSTWPNKPQPMKRQTIPSSPPKPCERLTKSKEQMSTSLNTDIANRQQVGVCSEVPAVSRKTEQSDLVSDRYAHRIYEDIDDFDVDQSSSKTAVHSVVNKSPAFEAKMAALASIDFGKTAKPVATVAQTENPVEESSPVKTNVTPSVQDAALVPAGKPEKTRKSGGKTFFQKFLKFGSKDASEAARSSVVSSADEASLQVVQFPASSSAGTTNVSDDAKSSQDATPSQAAPLTEKQAMLVNLKQCLAKRQNSDSSELSPIHPRTRSSESTPLRSSTQSVGSVQQAHDNISEDNENQTVIILETSPPVDTQSSSPSIHGPSSSTDLSFSPPQPSCKELSETDRSLRSVDRTANEMQRLDVKDLTVLTEDAGNVDGSVSICSSDAVSPTPSDLSMEGTDHHSLKRKSRTDKQGTSCVLVVVFYHLTTGPL